MSHLDEARADDLSLPEDATLLIVDDDEPFRTRLGRALEKRGFQPILAAGVSDGSIRHGVDPMSVAAQYIAYISGMTYLWLINPSSVDFRKANDDMKTHLRLSLQSNENDTARIKND